MTKYGKQIVNLVSCSHDHLTAEQIYLQLRQRGVMLSLAAVYNNLKNLVEDGVLRKITLDGSPDRFDKATGHQHLICSGCGRLSDVEIRDLTDILRQDTETEVLSYDLKISYLCEECRRKREQNQ